MAATCDGCGTKKNVKRAFITFWNGNILDLCLKCTVPLSKVMGTEGKKTKRYRKVWLDNDGKR